MGIIPTTVCLGQDHMRAWTHINIHSQNFASVGCSKWVNPCFPCSQNIPLLCLFMLWLRGDEVSSLPRPVHWYFILKKWAPLLGYIFSKQICWLIALEVEGRSASPFGVLMFFYFPAHYLVDQNMWDSPVFWHLRRGWPYLWDNLQHSFPPWILYPHVTQVTGVPFSVCKVAIILNCHLNNIF